VEHALYRGSLLSARISLPGALRWLRTYSTYESLWPPFFRPIRRSKVTALYLRALSHSHGSPQSSSSPLELVGGQSSRVGRGEEQQAGMAWHVEAERSMRSAWAMMEGSGRAFPKAGERRDEVEEFVVSCVALWEKGGQKKGSELDLVIKVTFHPYRDVWRSTAREIRLMANPLKTSIFPLLRSSGGQQHRPSTPNPSSAISPVLSSRRPLRPTRAVPLSSTPSSSTKHARPLRPTVPTATKAKSRTWKWTTIARTLRCSYSVRGSSEGTAGTQRRGSGGRPRRRKCCRRARGGT
jgi:hypothetical protein